MRKYTPYMILAIGLLALAIDLLPNLKLHFAKPTRFSLEVHFFNRISFAPGYVLPNAKFNVVRSVHHRTTPGT